jgi:hypothetical protein
MSILDHAQVQRNSDSDAHTRLQSGLSRMARDLASVAVKCSKRVWKAVFNSEQDITRHGTQATLIVTIGCKGN